MLAYNIRKPIIKDNKWLVFKDSIFTNLSTMDCNDAIEGRCYRKRSLNECIDICDKSPHCDYGYHIKDKNNQYCVPLQNLFEVDPRYMIRNKNIYPELKNATTNIFVNKNYVDFPPNKTNVVFFMDDILLQNIETGTILSSFPSSKNMFVRFGKGDDLQLQILKIPSDLSATGRYISLRYGNKFMFNIPTTTFVMEGSSDIYGYMKWISKSFSLISDLGFILEPIDNSKKYGDVVNYSDNFMIKYGTSILEITDDFYVNYLYQNNYKDAKRNGKNVTFRFIPRMKGYYCKDGKCSPIPLSKIKIENGIGKYDGSIVTRSPGCWGFCKKLSVKKYVRIILISIIIIAFFILIKKLYFY